jgi:hypothetical protein
LSPFYGKSEKKHWVSFRALFSQTHLVTLDGIATIVMAPFSKGLFALKNVQDKNIDFGGNRCG